jgi:hypothetical protein
MTIFGLLAALAFVMWNPGEQRYALADITWP